MSALLDVRLKWLRCRVCDRRFRSSGGPERVVDHIERAHPESYLGMWRELALLREEAERELSGKQAGGRGAQP